jgi:hypothetical protein
MNRPAITARAVRALAECGRHGRARAYACTASGSMTHAADAAPVRSAAGQAFHSEPYVCGTGARRVVGDPAVPALRDALEQITNDHERTAMSDVKCAGLTPTGEPCDKPAGLVGPDGYCLSHRPGPEGEAKRAAISAAGGRATAARLGGEAFTAGDLPPLVSIEDAKLALDAIRVATLTRRITHSESRAAAGAVKEWIAAETAAQTQRLVNELSRELEAKTEEIKALRKQLGGKLRAVR